MNATVKKETSYIAVWVLALSLVLEAVFLILRQWNLAVLLGNAAGADLAIGNYAMLGNAVAKAVESGEPDKAAMKIRASRNYRLLGMAGICALLIGLLKTNVYATLIPLLFPRIGLAFRPMIDRKRGIQAPKTEGGEELLD